MLCRAVEVIYSLKADPFNNLFFLAFVLLKELTFACVVSANLVQYARVPAYLLQQLSTHTLHIR